jgi:D-alanine-D-alanine ligase
VVAVGVTLQGRWVHVSEDPADWQLEGSRTPQVAEDGDEVLLPAAHPGPGRPAQLRVIRGDRVEVLADVDVFFPLLHGPYGEDGTVQGALDLLDLPYVGSGVLASATCMDKAATKSALAHAGIDSAPWEVIREEDWAREAEEVTARVSAELDAPWFVKPARAGSSVGVSRVTDPAEFEHAVKTAFAEDPKILVEQGVVGREVECGVLQGRSGAPVRTTLPGEVVVGDDLEFYDYEAKYFGKGTVAIEVPAALPESVQDRVRQVASSAFAALGLEGLARVDVFVTADGAVVVNEVNTMPGFTPYSMFPVLWDRMGLQYGDLITELVELARERRLGLR